MHKQQNHPALTSSISNFTPATPASQHSPARGGALYKYPEHNKDDHHTTAGALERPQNFGYKYQNAHAYMHSSCMLSKLSSTCYMPYGSHKPDSWSCQTFQQPFCKSSINNYRWVGQIGSASVKLFVASTLRWCACKDYMIFQVMSRANPVLSELRFDLHDELRDQKCCLLDLRVSYGTSAANHLNACFWALFLHRQAVTYVSEECIQIKHYVQIICFCAECCLEQDEQTISGKGFTQANVRKTGLQ